MKKFILSFIILLIHTFNIIPSIQLSNTKKTVIVLANQLDGNQTPIPFLRFETIQDSNTQKRECETPNIFAQPVKTIQKNVRSRNATPVESYRKASSPRFSKNTETPTYNDIYIKKSPKANEQTVYWSYRYMNHLNRNNNNDYGYDDFPGMNGNQSYYRQIYQHGHHNNQYDFPTDYMP